MKKTALIKNLVFFGLTLIQLIGYSQPPIGDEGFNVIKEAYSYDINLPLKPVIAEVKDYASHTRTKIYYAGTNEKVGAYLAIPNKGNGPFPVVLLIDGLGGSKERWWGKNNWSNGMETTEALISKGFAVFTIDAALHGERFTNTENFPEPSTFRRQNLMNTMHTMIFQTVQDYMRGLDYLETRNDINTEKVGAYGLSMGGAVTFIITGLDNRIKTAVTGVAVVYGNQYSVVNAYNFTPRIKTKPLLMLMGDTDGYYTPKTATQLFNSIGGDANELIIFKGGHKVPPSYIPAIANWFEKGLK